MLFTFHERVPQKGKYNLYYTFGKGYINQVRELREHYGTKSSFQHARPKIMGKNFEENFTRPERNTFSSDNQRHSLNSSKEYEEGSSKVTICNGFDKFLQKGNEEIANDYRTLQQKSELTLSSSLKQSQAQNAIRFGSSSQKERFENLSLTKSNEFPDSYSKINHLVPRNNPTNIKAIDYYKQNFDIKEKNFDAEKINLTGNLEKLTTPLEKRMEIQEAKNNKAKFDLWKRERMNSQKKYRVAKGGFKSGILNIDNPQNEYTKIYEDEYKDYMKKEIARKMIEARHRKQLENLTKTSSDIAFLNKNSRQNNRSDTKEEIKISSSWSRKGRIKDNFYKEYLETHDRLFGSIPNRYSIPRAENIMNCENKGKDWDIISFKTNNVQLKIDKGTKKDL